MDNLVEREEQRSHLKRKILSVYGTNIRKLVDYTLTLKTKEERNAAARQIIEAMKIINRKSREMDDDCVLWNHLAMISDYKLDVDYPCEITPVEAVEAPPEPVEYPQKELSHKHYGSIVMRLIDKALEMEPGQLREELVKLILFLMKKHFVLYGKSGGVVKDEVIFNDLEKITGGLLKAPEGFSLPRTKEIYDAYRNAPEIEREKRQSRKNYKQKNN